MEELAPSAVALAARLGTSRDDDGGGDRAVVGAVPGRDVCVAPVDVQDLGERIGVGLTTGAVQPREDGGFRAELSHGSLRREGFPSAGAIARIRK
jgi:hypothetical protein